MEKFLKYPIVSFSGWKVKDGQISGYLEKDGTKVVVLPEGKNLVEGVHREAKKLWNTSTHSKK